MKTASIALAALLCAAPTLASADDLTVPMPEGTKVQRLKASYVCPGIGPFTAEYVTAGDISLALLPVDGRPLVFANVLSGSGVRYAAGPYVWWTKGNSAALYDVRKGEKAEPVQCEEKQ
ncbi:MliC family protein [Aquabacter sp. CN5-332]|uniref:MliC family protein n=1 Tax=Aquabacter sp. CN5-332 TaxID=3156608 RepID=UPI0032B3422E